MTQSVVVHITHEAALKIGGIGAVLEGLLSTETYNRHVARSILAGPFPTWDAAQMDRIVSPRSHLQVKYASRYGIFGLVAPELGQRLLRVERELNVDILYAETRYGRHRHEVLLVDPTRMARETVHAFAHDLWREYGVVAADYGFDLEWQGFIDLAVPLARAIAALVQDAAPELGRPCLIAHDWMGMPPIMALQMRQPGAWSSLFYAHEVAPVRRIVEEHAGHDTRFYNVMWQGRDWNLYLDNLFGSQHDLYKTPILHQASRCDGILAVSDLVVEELKFLGAAFEQAPIDLVYNGVPFQSTGLAEKNESRERLRAYCHNLLGFRPDFVFSHVTRMVLSKGLWRDMKVLSHLAELLHRRGPRTAVLFVLSTSVVTGRAPDRIRHWEEAYGWPVGHRADNGDLVGPEVPYFFDVVEPFNQTHANVKVVFVNQFGWDRSRCGARMPRDMAFQDLRVGSDLEFGQSIYEPFGIAQLEPLTQGAVCCTSSACGCRGFVQRVTETELEIPLYVEADYVNVPDPAWNASPHRALDIDQTVRNRVEDEISQDVARRIYALLPFDDRIRARHLEVGQAASRAMSWEVVARDCFLPALHRVRDRAA